MPDSYGRPTLNDWAAMTSVIDHASNSLEADAAEKRGVRAAQLTNVMAKNPDVKINMNSEDPRVVQIVENNVRRIKLQKMRNSEEGMRLRAARFDQDRNDAAWAAYMADEAHKRGDTKQAHIYRDFAVNHMPTPFTITKREGDQVTLMSPLGKSKTYKDDIPWDQSMAMIRDSLKSGQQYMAEWNARDEFRWRHNANAETNPTPVMNIKTGEMGTRTSVIDTNTHLPAEITRDSKGNIVDASGPGAGRFLSLQQIQVQSAAKRLQGKDAGKIVGTTTGPKLLIQSADGSLVAMVNPAYVKSGGKPEMMPSKAMSELARVQGIKAKLNSNQPGEVAQAVSVIGLTRNDLSADSRKAIQDFLAGGKKTLDPKVKRAITETLDVYSNYLLRFVPDPARYHELNQQLVAAGQQPSPPPAGGQSGSRAAPMGTTGATDNYDFIYDAKNNVIVPKQPAQ